ncbi:hypothetical protein I4U23_003766 [Adineta vaga]|nr:hypothetical protein I4U23_003766 [Adineta vaga]
MSKNKDTLELQINTDAIHLIQATDEEINYLKQLRLFQLIRKDISFKRPNFLYPSMIIDNFLYHGTIEHARNMNLLQELNIRHIINISDVRLRSDIVKKLEVLWINVEDLNNVNIRQYFDQTNEFLHRCRRNNHTVLVTCRKGVSRSSSIILAYLLKFHHDNVQDAYASIIVYFQYPSQISVEIVTEWPQAFPAVTICNYSPFVYSKFIDPFLDYSNATQFSETESLYVRDFLRDTLDRKETLSQFSFPLESMLMSCSYNNMACSSVNFTSFASLRYGTCYTFNAKPKNTSSNDNHIRYTLDNAGEGTFELTFYVHRHQYVPYITKGVGMMVLVHDNIQFPVTALSGMQLSPGRNHKLSYTKRTNVLLPPPYTSCTNHISLAMRTTFDRYQSNDYAYTQYVCYNICLQKMIYEKCGCVGPTNWATRFIELPNSNQIITASLCNWTNVCCSRVTSEFYNPNFSRDESCSECGPECITNTFNIKSSSLVAPIEFQLKNIKKFVESSSIPLPTNWSTIWSTEIPANYISLEVVCETTRTEIYTQQASITFVELISNIGGQTGLWIGISFLSLFEIIEMLYRLVRSKLYSWQNATMNNDRQTTIF